MTFGQSDLQVFPSDLGVHAAMPRIMALCRSGDWKTRSDHLDNIQIAVTEALNNVAEHGFAGMKPVPILVRVLVRKARITISIIDQGHPYPTHRVPQPKEHDLSVDLSSLPEGGFGWMLIHSLTSELSYTRITGENRLCLHFDLEIA